MRFWSVPPSIGARARSPSPGADSMGWSSSTAIPAFRGCFSGFSRCPDVPRETLNHHVHIHEAADAEAADDWWADEQDLPRELFQRPSIKKHKRATKRINAGAGYHGCLVISVPSSRQLYWRVEGVMAALTGLG